MKKAEPDPNLSTAGRRTPPAPRHESLRAAAEELAVKALIFLAADEDRIRRFSDISGLCLENLRAAAESPNFLAGVLDYLAGDESLLLAFAANSSIDPAQVQRAQAILSPLSEA